MRIFILVFLFVFSLAGCQSGDRNTKKGKNPVTAADSLEIITEMIRQDSSDYQLYLQRAHLNVKLGKIDPAFRDVNRALELNSQAPETFVLLSDLYFIMGNAEDAIAALKKYKASKKSLQASEEAFRYTQQKFDLGLLNSVDYNLAKNHLTKVQSDVLQAKYEFMFKSNILQFYRGTPMSY